MGGAMTDGFIKSGAVKPAHISVANPTAKKLEHFALQGACVTTDNKTAADGADIVIIAVKPWLEHQGGNDLKPVLNYARQTVITVAAGISGSQFTAWLKKDDEFSAVNTPQTFIVIPNTAIAVLSSMTFVVPVNATADTTATIKELFDNVGQTMVTEERLLGAGMTLASCGIAYAMRYVRAAAEGGVELGFKADVAKDIVLQTLKGAVDLLQANGNHPEAEIDKVCTPGGLTIRGLNEMEHAGFTSAVIRGLKAGVK